MKEQRSIPEWARLIRSEYREMPGLRLTRPQAQRLWALDPQFCSAVLDALVAERTLEKTHGGEYVLAGAQRP
jgi:hypothetical protein